MRMNFVNYFLKSGTEVDANNLNIHHMTNQEEKPNSVTLEYFIKEHKEYNPIEERKRIEHEIKDNDDYAQNILKDELKRIENRLEKMGENIDNEFADLNSIYYWHGFNSVKYKDHKFIGTCPSSDFKDVLNYYAQGIRDANLNQFLKNLLEETQKKKAINNENSLLLDLNKNSKQISPQNSFDFISVKTANDQILFVGNILDKLKQNGFVNDKVKSVDFKKMFSNTPLNKINPIDWKKSIASLRYFIKTFPFDVLINDVSKFKIAADCFTHKDIKLTYTQIDNAKQTSTKDKIAINNIFKETK